MYKQKSVNLLTVFRGLTALSIVWHHTQLAGTFISPSVFGQNILWFINYNGVTGVTLFIVLSGYVIGKGFFGKKYRITVRSLLLYFWKRFIRIAPLYYLTLLAIILIFGQKISGYKELILRLFTFTAYYPYLVWPFYYLWTISVLVHYYLLAPAIYLFSKLLIGKFRINPLIPLFAVLIIGLVYRSYSYFLQFPPNPLQGMALAADVRQNLYIFTFGFLLNPLVNLIKNRVSLFLNLYRPGISLILLLLIFLAGPVNAALQHFNPADFGMYGLTLSYAPVLLLSALFIVISESGLGISGSGSRLKQFFLLPLYILQIIGTLSYELYLFHYPVIIKLGNSCESGCTLSQFFLKIIFTVSVCATMALTIGLISGAAKNFTRRYTVKLFS